MEDTNLKNMVVLKNLPSNLVEEAIVILKSNKKAKKLEFIENIKKIENNDLKIKDNEYVLKEAQMVVGQYLLKAEEKQETKEDIVKEKRNYKRLKNYASISTFIILVQLIALIIN